MPRKSVCLEVSSASREGDGFCADEMEVDEARCVLGSPRVALFEANPSEKLVEEAASESLLLSAGLGLSETL